VRVFLAPGIFLVFFFLLLLLLLLLFCAFISVHRRARENVLYSVADSNDFSQKYQNRVECQFSVPLLICCVFVVFQIESGLAGGGGGGGGCCWIVEWCGIADRTKRRALAPNLRSTVVVAAADAVASSSLSCPHDTKGHGRSASSLIRRSRQQQQQQQPSARNHNHPTNVNGSSNPKQQQQQRLQKEGGYSSFSRSPSVVVVDSSGSSCCDHIGTPAAFLFHPSALPKRLQNVLDDKKKRLTLTSKRPAPDSTRRHIIAGRTAMSDNFIYGDITR
jgi:hypothetical protein